MKILERCSPQLLSILRIVAAALFLEHGTMKLLHFPAAMPGMDGPLPPLMLVAALLELVGGTMLLAGFMTRLVAFILSGEMAVAYFMAHAGNSFFPILNSGEPAILFCFVFLYLASAGPGIWSIDSAFLRRKSGADHTD